MWSSLVTSGHTKSLMVRLGHICELITSGYTLSVVTSDQAWLHQGRDGQNYLGSKRSGSESSDPKTEEQEQDDTTEQDP